MDTNMANMSDYKTQTQNYFATKEMKLLDEQKWLQEIEQVQKHENSFL